MEFSGVFIAGRQILAQALGANKIIDDYRKRNMERFIFEYNHVDYIFLGEVLEKKQLVISRGHGCGAV